MNRQRFHLVALTLVGLAVATLAGCQQQGDPGAPPASAKKVAKGTAKDTALNAASSPRSKMGNGLDSLPGMECLVDEFGLRVTVLITRPNARCLESPPAGAVRDTVVKYFRPYFVFDTYPAKGPAQFYQIGATPRRGSVVGWIPAPAVAVWPTRVGGRHCRAPVGGIRPGTRVPPLLVYRDKDSLIEILQTGVTRAEPMARAARHAERTVMPWPISRIAQVTVNGQVRELALLNFVGEFKEGTLLAGDPAPSKAAPLTAEEVKQIRQRIEMLDIVFVLDVTGSMGPYIEAAKATVRDISRRLRELPFKPNIAFGLLAYRDHDAASGFVTRHFDLQGDYNVFLSKIAALEAKEGGDTPEAVYDGIYDALEKTSWRGQGLSARCLVLIGDASAHEPGDVQNPRNISRDQLVEMARKRGAKIFALAVGDKNADRVRMWKQFSDLSRRAGGDCFPIANAATVVERVRAVLKTETATVQQRAIVFDDLAGGKKPAQIAAERHLDIRKITEIMEFLKGAGIDVSRMSAGQPEYAAGWALCEVDGVPLLDREVYIARAELDVLLATLNLLCSRLSADFGRQAFGAGLSGRVNPLTSFFDGDVPEPLDVILMAKGVPVGRTSVLRMTANEIRHMSESRRAALRDRIARQLIPALVNARNDDSLWTYRGDIEFGWIPERILP